VRPVADGFTVDRSALRETAQGINDTLGALEKLGFNEVAGVGRGFSGLALSGLQVGHAGLQSALGGFCDRWSWGVRTLMQDGNQIAQRLGLSAGIYAATEQEIMGSIKNLVDAGAGDPHLSDAQVAQGSWAQAAGVTPAQAPDDFSSQAWHQAGGQIAQTWTTEGHDVTHTAGDLLDP
jgi:hypothetical protein